MPRTRTSPKCPACDSQAIIFVGHRIPTTECVPCGYKFNQTHAFEQVGLEPTGVHVRVYLQLEDGQWTIQPEQTGDEDAKHGYTLDAYREGPRNDAYSSPILLADASRPNPPTLRELSDLLIMHFHGKK